MVADPTPPDTPALQRSAAGRRTLDAEHDADTLPARAQQVLPGLRQVERVPRVGHGMIGEDPEMVATRIAAFIKEIDP